MTTVIYYIYNNSLNQSEQATMKDCWLNSQISKGFTQKTIKCEKTVGHQLVHKMTSLSLKTESVDSQSRTVTVSRLICVSLWHGFHV